MQRFKLFAAVVACEYRACMPLVIHVPFLRWSRVYSYSLYLGTQLAILLFYNSLIFLFQLQTENYFNWLEGFHDEIKITDWQSRSIMFWRLFWGLHAVDKYSLLMPGTHLHFLHSALLSQHSAMLDEWSADYLMAWHTKNELCSTYAQLWVYKLI